MWHEKLYRQAGRRYVHDRGRQKEKEEAEEKKEMILPKDIKSLKHKVRDAAIIALYLDGCLPDEIKATGRFNITVRRIWQILYDNRDFISSKREWEKTQQIIRLKRQVKKRPDSNKDIIEVEKTLSDVLKSSEPSIDQSEHTLIQYINYGEINTKKEGEIANTDRRLSTT